MSPKRHLDDQRLARLIGAVGAEANPAVLARARSRIAAGAGSEPWTAAVPAGIAWLFRPLALTGAAAACVLVLAGGLWFGGATGAASGTSLLATSSETLPGALLDDLAASDASPSDGVARDSGGPS